MQVCWVASAIELQERAKANKLLFLSMCCIGMNDVKTVQRFKPKTPKLPAIYFNFVYVCLAFNSFLWEAVGRKNRELQVAVCKTKIFYAL